MNISESKMAKSLLNHNLQNLVFQKRQRKSIQQTIPNNTLNTLNITNIKSKTNIIKKTLNNSKKNHQKQQKINKTKKINKIRIKQRKNQISQQKIKTLKTQSTKNKSKTQIKNHKFRRILRKNKIQTEPKNIINQQKIVAINKIVQKKQKIQEHQTIQNKINQVIIESPIKKKGRPKKIIQQSQQNQENQNKQHNNSAPKCRALLKLQSDNKLDSFLEDSVPKVRQAKLNALKKYSEKQLFPDQSEEIQKVIYSQKKKRISKVQSQYSINRIFRKQPKLDLNAIDIPVKLNQLSLNAFVNKFDTFDVIHTSLPLSMLWQLPELDNLMIKGFIFIWVQKGQIPLAYHLLNRLGYDVIDQIIWIKCNQQLRTVYNEPITQEQPQLSQQNLFANSKSMCMVGYKCPQGQKAQYRTKISNNIIFANPFSNPIQKPDQIFQIADLLMPGSKKLQLGGPPQKGWLSLSHNQTRLHKCYKCFKKADLNSKIFINKKDDEIKSICNLCFTKNIETNVQSLEINSQNSNSISQEPQISQNQTIKINKVIYISNFSELKCSKCSKQQVNQLIRFSFSSPQQQSLCKNCLYEQFTKHLTLQICDLIVKKNIYFNRLELKCSECSKNTLIQKFYECSSSNCKNKNHILCTECFWKSGYQTFINNNSNETNRKKTDGLHEFKMRKITSYPNGKLTCVCKNDLTLPYYVCETCVGLRWCRKCKLSINELQNHSVNFSDQQKQKHKHKLTLIN